MRDEATSETDYAQWVEQESTRTVVAGCRVTICEHLDGQVGIVYGPQVVGRYTAQGAALGTSGKASEPPRERSRNPFENRLHIKPIHKASVLASKEWRGAVCR